MSDLRICGAQVYWRELPLAIPAKGTSSAKRGFYRVARQGCLPRCGASFTHASGSAAVKTVVLAAAPASEGASGAVKQRR